MLTLALTSTVLVFLVLHVVYLTRKLRFHRSLEEAVETMQLGVTVCDLDGNILYVNPAEARMHGFEVKELIGQSVRSFAPRDKWNPMSRSKVRAMNSWQRESVNIRKDGTAFPVLLRSNVVLSSEGEPIGVVTCCEDITGRKEAEKLAAEHQGTLEAGRLKNDFVATMSHEIRTPLHGVIGRIDLLLDTPLSDEQRRHALAARASGNLLLTLVNDVLDFSKLEAGRMALEVIDFSPRALIEDIVGLVELRAREKNLELRVDVGPEVPAVVRGDPMRVSQILLNLADNAVKFTQRGLVQVRATVENPGKDPVMLAFEVRDTGLGMNRAEVMRVFEPFTQADSSTTRKFGGTGLGLAISRRLTALMEGSIDVDSRRGEGTIFKLRLPFPRSSEMVERNWRNLENHQPSNVEEDMRNVVRPAERMILVAEDNPMNLELALLQLRTLGYSARGVSNGKEAVAAADDCSLVLMDVQMPEMDGYAATREIRRQAEERGARRVPILAMTAGARDDDRKLCLEAGMDGFIAKPVTRKELGAALEQALSRHREPLDPSKMLELDLLRAPGEADVVLKLIKLFQDFAPKKLEAMRHALDTGDARSAQQAAHALKSSAASLGARSMAALCERIENSTESSALSGLGPLLRQLEEEHVEVARELEDLRKRRQSDPGRSA